MGEGVHSSEANVEAAGSVIDSEDIDALAVVLELPAGSARGRVPAGNGVNATDVGELGDVALGLPAGVLGHEAVAAVGARDGSEGSGLVIVAGIV